MLTESIARRYAKALFNIAVERRILDQVASDIASVLEVTSLEKRFYDLLLSPRLPAKSKKQLFTKLFPKIQEVTRNFLFLLVDKRREVLLPEVVVQYKRLMEEYKKIQPVCVVSASDIPPAVIELLTQNLERYLKKKVTLHVSCDPEILGGLVISIGDIRIDGSIKNKLEQLRDRLLRLPA